MKNSERAFFGTLLILLTLLSGCATYYRSTAEFQKNLESGELEEANRALDRHKNAATDRNRLLYFMQKGVVLQMLGEFEESNRWLEEAYLFTEDYRQSTLNRAVALVTNPAVKPYTGEDHERVLIHYYKAMNFLQMKRYEEALVECRRINNRLNQLNDRYEGRKNRYRQDAFALNLMGIVYEASGDLNNAFIAYRNAWEVYATDYREHFSMPVPEQLKKDLLRTAWLNGFTEELRRFEAEFSTEFEPTGHEGGELLFFWHNGLGPVKSEWSLNFLIVRGQGGGVMFVNEELGMSFPFPLSAAGESDGGLADLKMIRVAFPQYLERRPVNRQAELTADGTTYRLEMAEDINQIAFKTLEDRMVREFANSLLRLALKQAAEAQTRKLNKNLGALLSIFNAVSEKADTRNWQSLPYSISYARVPLEAGSNTVTLHTSAGSREGAEHTFEFHAEPGETLFHTFHSLESIPLPGSGD